MTPRLLHSSHPSASPLFSRSVRHSPPYPPVLSSRPVRSGARDRRRMTSVTRRQGTWVGWSGSCRRVPTSALRPAAPSSRRFLRSWSLRGSRTGRRPHATRVRLTLRGEWNERSEERSERQTAHSSLRFAVFILASFIHKSIGICYYYNSVWFGLLLTAFYL